MSHYRIIQASYWTSTTGRQIRALGREAQALGVYLFSNAHSNLLGLYHLPISYIVEDIGGSAASIERTLDALSTLEDVTAPSTGGMTGRSRGVDGAFALYDTVSSFVWVIEMARVQLSLKPGQVLTLPVAGKSKGDSRIEQIRKVYDGLGDNPFLGQFFDYHGRSLGLDSRRDGRTKWTPRPRGVDGASTGRSRGVDGPVPPRRRGSVPVPVSDPVYFGTDGSLSTDNSRCGDASAPLHDVRGHASGDAVNAFLRWFGAEYPGHNKNARYAILAKIEMPLVRRLLDTWDLDRLKLMAVRLWDDAADEFIAKSDRGIKVLSVKASYLDGQLAKEATVSVAPEAWICRHEPPCGNRSTCAYVTAKHEGFH